MLGSLEDPNLPTGEVDIVLIEELHKMTEAQAIREVGEAGLDGVETWDFLPMQHVLVFQKPASGA